MTMNILNKEQINKQIDITNSDKKEDLHSDSTNREISQNYNNIY